MGPDYRWKFLTNAFGAQTASLTTWKKRNTNTNENTSTCQYHHCHVRGGEMGPDYRDAFRVQTASLYNLEIQIQVQIHDMMGPDYSYQSECIGDSPMVRGASLKT